MRFIILGSYADVGTEFPPLSEWSDEDVQAHMAFQQALDEQLVASGEYVGCGGLAGPDEAKIVVAGGDTAPVITDGPFAESKELLAGYRLVEVDSLDRALEIAVLISAAPAVNGKPLRQPIEVRQVMYSRDNDTL